jgi:hypothetical protein
MGTILPVHSREGSEAVRGCAAAVIGSSSAISAAACLGVILKTT